MTRGERGCSGWLPRSASGFALEDPREAARDCQPASRLPRRARVPADAAPRHALGLLRRAPAKTTDDGGPARSPRVHRVVQFSQVWPGPARPEDRAPHPSHLCAGGDVRYLHRAAMRRALRAAKCPCRKWWGSSHEAGLAMERRLDPEVDDTHLQRYGAGRPDRHAGPCPGLVVRRGRSVRVWISAAPVFFAVVPRSSARLSAQRRPVEPGRPGRYRRSGYPSSDFPSDSVVAQDPPPGSRPPVGSSSTGANCAAGYVMPD